MSNLKASGEAERQHIVIGSPEYFRSLVALVACGFASFALLYCVQPLFPLFSAAFGISPAASAVSLSAPALVLTVTIFLGGIASEHFGRKRIMALSLFGTAICNQLSAIAPDWQLLVVCRILVGVVAGGVSAVAIAYLAEEMEPSGLGFAMGLYVGGNCMGGMLGRLLTGAIAEVAGWRMALTAMSLLGLVAAMAFVLLLPPSRNWRPAEGYGSSYHSMMFGRVFQTPMLPLLLAFPFFLIAPFTAVYNYAGYRLILPPYHLGQATLGAVFLVYIFGVVGSGVCGRAADRFGRGRVMVAGVGVIIAGMLLTMAKPLVAVVTGMAIITFGFFGAHAVASAWVGRLGAASKGHATAIYMLSFYLGITIHGVLAGWFWQYLHWEGVVGIGLVACACALALAVALSRGEPGNT